MANFLFNFDVPSKSLAAFQAQILSENNVPRKSLLRMARFLQHVVSGLTPATITVADNDTGIWAVARINLTGVPASGGTVVIDGTTLTWVDGAAANENEISRDGLSTSTDASNAIAAAINAHSVLSLSFAAVASLTVCIVMFREKGVAGNAIEISETSTFLTLSGDNFTGGVDGDAPFYSNV